MATLPNSRIGSTAPTQPRELSELVSANPNDPDTAIARPSHPVRSAARARAIAGAVVPATLQAEIDSLPSDQLLVDGGAFRVYLTSARQTPWVLQEIGRLREVTFRAVGEGSGKSVDIDAFDAHYLHLFLWDIHAAAIVGAYRLGLVDEILATRGKRGLYTYSLFKYRAQILRTLNPIELGRSFVRAEYQRSFFPMMLLWRGIGRFVERSPRYAVLFGAVSISNSYSPASRQLIVDYLSSHAADPELRHHVTPRRPFRPPKGRFEIAQDWRPEGIDALSRAIAQIEPDHKGIPVLLRQYLRLGGRVVAFNVDRRFADVLDGLIMVDLRQIEPGLLARYMGKSGTIAFRAYHVLDS